MIENDYYIFYATAKVNGRRENIQCWHGYSKTLPIGLIKHKGLHSILYMEKVGLEGME